MADKPLEDVLRAKEKAGLNYLSIAHLDNGQWEVSYRGVENNDFRHAQHEDVVCALRKALTGRPGEEPKRRRKQPPRTTKPEPKVKPAPAADTDDDALFGDL